LCARTWLPRPTANRPFECLFRSQAWFATIIGLRGNAIATDGTSATLSVAIAAKARGVKGSCRNSLLVTTSAPSSSAWRAATPQAAQSCTGNPIDTRMSSPCFVRPVLCDRARHAAT